MTLTEAITKLSNSPPTKMTFAQVESLGIVLAAARAVNCKTCGGCGWIFRVSPLYTTIIDEKCPYCHDDRKKAGIV